MEKKLIHGETLGELEGAVVAMGQPKFRAKQVADWLYKKRACSWAEMTNLPVEFREKLEDEYVFCSTVPIKIHKSQDTTRKYLMQLGDGSLVETVSLWAPDVEDETGFGRVTVCLSTQVGCAYGCNFCASGLSGFKRNLEAGEIVDQLLTVATDIEKESGKTDRFPIDNIVVMGMGEPLANYQNLIQALTIINSDWGLRFGARRITVSTSGLVPEIEKLADEKIQFRLAISLHGTTNEVRNQIMPINRKYPLEKLFPAIKQYSEKRGRMITLEYILIRDLNDSLSQAQQLAKIAHYLHAHVNLIPCNKVESLSWIAPMPAVQKQFIGFLKSANVSATIRLEKGDPIAAACGQLSFKTKVG
ncbi:MAG: 23S rRNA (adenine(2503)-C(2))-methyltransferase [Verrucomicrobia bacterium GWC2_42_7]|nr:MAG: 23S rRNA (adenine(2503)-C(2))-methyltransferase [Verrucomicrobia bacterium GWC2_42_7]